ncbi:hypothetical protein T492DRAFT_864243 [Pavlovales sp. CCMP2436]|nr:hypothetical protein T492DRAFT_864243 [Pavlovales sp. CCMP2436]
MAEAPFRLLLAVACTGAAFAMGGVPSGDVDMPNLLSFIPLAPQLRPPLFEAINESYGKVSLLVLALMPILNTGRYRKASTGLHPDKFNSIPNITIYDEFKAGMLYKLSPAAKATIKGTHLLTSPLRERPLTRLPPRSKTLWRAVTTLKLQLQPRLSIAQMEVMPVAFLTDRPGVYQRLCQDHRKKVRYAKSIYNQIAWNILYLASGDNPQLVGALMQVPLADGPGFSTVHAEEFFNHIAGAPSKTDSTPHPTRAPFHPPGRSAALNGPLDDAGKARVDVLRAALGLTAGVEVEAEASVQISFHRAPALRSLPCTRKRRLQRFVSGFLIIHHFYQLPTSA